MMLYTVRQLVTRSQDSSTLASHLRDAIDELDDDLYQTALAASDFVGAESWDRGQKSHGASEVAEVVRHAPESAKALGIALDVYLRAVDAARAKVVVFSGQSEQCFSGDWPHPPENDDVTP